MTVVKKPVPKPKTTKGKEERKKDFYDPWGWEHENDRPASTKETITIISITVAGIVQLASL